MSSSSRLKQWSWSLPVMPLAVRVRLMSCSRLIFSSRSSRFETRSISSGCCLPFSTHSFFQDWKVSRCRWFSSRRRLASSASRLSLPFLAAAWTRARSSSSIRCRYSSCFRLASSSRRLTSASCRRFSTCWVNLAVDCARTSMAAEGGGGSVRLCAVWVGEGGRGSLEEAGAKLNSQTAVVLFCLRLRSSASSNWRWSRSKSGGCLARGWLEAGRAGVSWVCRCACFCSRSFSMRGGSLALARFSCASLAMRSLRSTSCCCFCCRRSTEQNQGMGLALKAYSWRSCLVFLGTRRPSKLKGRSLASVIIMLHFFRSSLRRRCSSSIRSYRPTSATLAGTPLALKTDSLGFSADVACLLACRSFSRASKEKG